MTEQMPLVGLREIADATSVGTTAVANWRVRYEDFPQPVAELYMGPVFWWPHVELWLRRNDRLDDGRGFRDGPALD